MNTTCNCNDTSKGSACRSLTPHRKLTNSSKEITLNESSTRGTCNANSMSKTSNVNSTELTCNDNSTELTCNDNSMSKTSNMNLTSKTPNNSPMEKTSSPTKRTSKNSAPAEKVNHVDAYPHEDVKSTFRYWCEKSPPLTKHNPTSKTAADV